MTEKRTPLVLLGITGCIAAYKACDLTRELSKAGCRVKVIMTENATRFVGPSTFRALTAEAVSVSLWDEPSARVHHISLAQEADVMVIAPATANVLAKLAHGRADDLLSTVALATRAPLIVAPAMNVAMWRAPSTDDNMAVLRDRGVDVVAPTAGELACGDTGDGRLAAVGDISAAVLAHVNRVRDLEGVSVLVTAGPTREPIDPVRFISNPSSGKTGYAIAREAALRGADVVLISGPTSLPAPAGVVTIPVQTALQMHEAVMARYSAADVVVATAAVSDFRPATAATRKVKKDAAELQIELTRNPDILAELGRAKGRRVLVGFAAETHECLVNAAEKLEAKNLDLVVANDVSDPSLGFASDDNNVWFVTQDRTEELSRTTKTQLATLLWDRIADAAREVADG